MAETSDSERTSEHVLDAEGHFHVEDAPIDLSHYLFEDWISLAFFWLLCTRLHGAERSAE